MADDVQNEKVDPWGEDLLNVKARGETFTKLIQSIEDSKVISIEAGFGRGKTFFRKAWAEHLIRSGEVVIEIDAQKSDHSGDPVVTFIGALMEKLPAKERSAWIKAWGTGKKLLWGATKIAASVAARKAGEEAMDALENKLAADGDKSLVDDLVTQFGKDASKSLSAQVTAQLSAERVRQEEMPKQLADLRDALTKDKGTGRVVILIDELDRCHPDYVIALLEAMKLVFDQDGYVFCLMVNSDYLQRMAEHRFGKLEDGWEYLEKFVDIRLSLGATGEVIGEAAAQIVRDTFVIGEPFGLGPEFTVERAAGVAAYFAPRSGLSLRKIKRILLRVEIALRCYATVPLDAPFLVFQAFKAANEEMVRRWENSVSAGHRVPRDTIPSRLTPSHGFRECREMWPILFHEDGRRFQTFTELGKASVKQVDETASGLPVERYVAEGEDGRRHRLFDQTQAMEEFPSKMVEKGIQPWYFKDHQEILEATYELLPDDEE